LFAALALGQQVAAAPVQYIRDVVYVPLRSGPSNQHRILQNVPSGTALTVLEKDGGSDFVRARTAAGAEGWLEAQYLVDKPIARDRLEALSAELERLRSQNVELREQLQGLRGARDESAQQARQLSRSSEQLAAELAEIKRVSASAVQLQQRYQAQSSEMVALRERAAALLAENGELREGRNQRAFLHGAFAVAIGCVLVLVTPRLWPRRRRSEWA
jgi:SH3 domain protein